MEKLKIKVFRIFLRLMTSFTWRKQLPKNVHVEKCAIPGPESEIATWIYTPQGSGPFPIIVYYHGGGFVVGDLKSHDPMCRDLCVKSQRIVVSVDYRLAPEFPFPAAPDDCFAALQWVVENVNRLNGIKNEIVVAGESAGGNLAAVTALQARDKLPNLLQGQMLFYPVTDYYEPSKNSYKEYGDGPGLTLNTMKWFWDLYLHNSPLWMAGDMQHYLATPLRVKDLSKLPPALVMTAEKDLLRDEGNAYAHRMMEQNVTVQHSVYAGEGHGFVGFVPNHTHHKAMAEIVAWLKQLPPAP